MVKTIKCRVCGSETGRDAPFGHCPKCLLQNGFTTAREGSPAQDDRGFGGYELEEIIGRGGMGVVYRARDKNLNRLVALKMIQRWRDASLNTLVRFRLEAEAAAKLEHPNIVPTYHIGEQQGQPFFTMKLIVGNSLGQRFSEWALIVSPDSKESSQILRSDRESQSQVATLIAKVARAVHYAHEHGVIHRDLKPNNILVDGEGEPHLTDFGIAKLLGHESGLTGPHDVLGTPAYMAPEQANGKSVTAAVDIYSLGAVLYSLLTGRPPFRGETPLETLRKVSEEEPLAPSRIHSGVDKELAAISLKCLEKDPMRRYGSALALAEDLERWLRREPVLARRAGPVLRLSRWVRRNPVGASLITTLCVGLTGALVLLHMVDAEKNRNTSALREVEKQKAISDRATRQTVELLVQQLEALWLLNDLKVLKITAEQLDVLTARGSMDVPRSARTERFTVGLAANENPVSDARVYAPLMAHLEQKLSERHGIPVRIDLKIYKFKEDRLHALLTNDVALARMGDIYFLKNQAKHPAFRALVAQNAMQKGGVFFTRTNSGIRTLKDLKGRSVAFGDAASGLTFWGQLKLVESGLAGRDLRGYVYLDSRTEFSDEVHDLGFDAALNQRGWLHSTAYVMEYVINGRYDAGVTTQRGFEKYKHRGLVRIEGSEFERALTPWVAGTALPPKVAQEFIEILTSFEKEDFLRSLPGSPSGFNRITEDSFNEAQKAMKRIEGLFPAPTESNDLKK